MGDKIGRIHLGRQDLKELQTRKMKGLKRDRGTDVEDEGSDIGDLDIVSGSEGGKIDDHSSDGVDLKRPRLI